MANNFVLYQTFDSNVPKKPLTANENEELENFFKNVKRVQFENIFMLICEYARKEDNFVFDFENLCLPYKIKQESDGIMINLTLLPQKLKRILLKFFRVL